MGGRWEWLAVPAAGTVPYIGDALHWDGLVRAGAYGPAAAVVCADAFLRVRPRGPKPGNGL